MTTDVAGPDGRDVLLIDLSSILYQHYHITSEDPDPNVASRMTVAKVRAYASGKPHVAICCDIGRSFRHTVDPLYKANRRPKEAPLFHQIERAADLLRGDGFPVWAVKGFEADDLIATATARAIMSSPGTHVTIISADKDLFQLVGERISLHRVTDNKTYGPFDVETAFGVRPSQIRDYLTLLGDRSDNITGCAKVGEKTAARLLKEFTSLDGVYQALAPSLEAIRQARSNLLDGRTGSQLYQQLVPELIKAGVGGPAIYFSLEEFEPRVAKSRELIALRTDVDIPFDELFQERTHAEVSAFIEEHHGMETPITPAPDASTSPATPGDPEPVVAPGPQAPDAAMDNMPPAAPETAMTVHQPEVLPVVVDYERQLDPRSPSEARTVAVDLFQSRLMSAYGSPQGVLSTIMLGRELGLPAMASLRAVHIIEGKHSLSADAMVALVLKSGFAEYFEPVEFSALKATWVTKRKGGRKEIEFTYTIEEATTAGLVKPNSGWAKSPTDMMNARAKAKLARLIYPDIVGGLYTPEELREIREAQAA